MAEGKRNKPRVIRKRIWMPEEHLGDEWPESESQPLDFVVSRARRRHEEEDTPELDFSSPREFAQQFDNDD